MNPNLMDDEALLAALGEALGTAQHARLPGIIASAREAFSFAAVGEEFARLVYDSVLADDLVGSRSGEQPRTVVFESDGLSVEVEIAPDSIVGQIAPAGAATVLAETSDGQRAQVDADDLGCFTLAPPGRGPVRFHVSRDGATTLTDWA